MEIETEKKFVAPFYKDSYDAADIALIDELFEDLRPMIHSKRYYIFGVLIFKSLWYEDKEFYCLTSRYLLFGLIPIWEKIIITQPLENEEASEDLV